MTAVTARRFECADLPRLWLGGNGRRNLLIAFLNARSMMGDGSLEITTSAALLVTYALGVLVGLDHTFTPVACAILMTLLLTWKLELRRLAGAVSMKELRAAVLLGLIGIGDLSSVVHRFIDRWETWEMPARDKEGTTIRGLRLD